MQTLFTLHFLPYLFN